MEVVSVTELLQALRDETAPDRKFTTPHGDYVWLKKCEVNGKILGVTDCCFVSDPCDYHARLTHQAPAATQ